jgi:hypothetical protein
MGSFSDYQLIGIVYHLKLVPEANGKRIDRGFGRVRCRVVDREGPPVKIPPVRTLFEIVLKGPDLP